jgi:hypothetical protein
MSLNCSHHHPPGGTSAWKTTVKWCQRRISGSSPRALWQSYHQNHLVPTRRDRRKEWWIWPWKVFLFKLANYFYIPNNMRPPASSPPKEGVLRNSIAIKNTSPLPDSNLRLLGLMGRTLTLDHRGDLQLLTATSSLFRWLSSGILNRVVW